MEYMEQGEIIAIDADGLWRVVLDRENYPENPGEYDEEFIPVMNMGDWMVRGDGWLAAGELGYNQERIIATFNQKADLWGNRSMETWMRYMRIFHGSKDFIHFSTSQGGRYLAFDTQAWRSRHGFGERVDIAKISDDIKTYTAYIEGDTWRFQMQHLFCIETTDSVTDEVVQITRYESVPGEVSFTVYGSDEENVMEQAHWYMEEWPERKVLSAVWRGGDRDLEEISRANADE